MKKLIAMLLAIVLMASGTIAVSAADSEEPDMVTLYFQSAMDEIGILAESERAMKADLMNAITNGDTYRSNMTNVYGFYDQMLVDQWDIAVYLRQLILTAINEIVSSDLDDDAKADLLSAFRNSFAYDLRSEIEAVFVTEIFEETKDYFQGNYLSDAVAGMDEAAGNMVYVTDYCVARTTGIRINLEIGEAIGDISHVLETLSSSYWNDQADLIPVIIGDFEYALNERMGTLPEGSALTVYGQYRVDLNEALNTINTEFNALLAEVNSEEAFLANQERIHAFYTMVYDCARTFTLNTTINALTLMEEAIHSDMTDAEVKLYLKEIAYFLTDTAVNEFYSLFYNELGDNIYGYVYDGMTRYCSNSDAYWDICDVEYDAVYGLTDGLYAIYNEFENNADDSMDDIMDCVDADRFGRALAMIKLYLDEFSAI